MVGYEESTPSSSINFMYGVNIGPMDPPSSRNIFINAYHNKAHKSLFHLDKDISHELGHLEIFDALNWDQKAINNVPFFVSHFLCVYNTRKSAMNLHFNLGHISQLEDEPYYNFANTPNPAGVLTEYITKFTGWLKNIYYPHLVKHKLTHLFNFETEFPDKLRDFTPLSIELNREAMQKEFLGD